MIIYYRLIADNCKDCMKKTVIFALFIIIASFARADDWESYEMIDRLLSLPGPGAPVIYEDYVIFTAPSDLRRVGVAFAHEDFAGIYWFRQLLLHQDPLNAPIPPGQKTPDPYIDSGILFHVYQVPLNVNELEYRLVINGLWTTDPLNSRTRRDPVTGLMLSVISVPVRQARQHPLNGLPDGLDFTFRGPPGEIVTVAGNFNGWDPFMYQLKENPEGVYSIRIPLPPGIYHYVFYHRGQRYTDPYNPRRIYARDGSSASVVEITN
jgi:hypothetical protein